MHMTISLNSGHFYWILLEWKLLEILLSSWEMTRLGKEESFKGSGLSLKMATTIYFIVDVVITMIVMLLESLDQRFLWGLMTNTLVIRYWKQEVQWVVEVGKAQGIALLLKVLVENGWWFTMPGPEVA